MDWIQQWQSKLNKQNGVAPLVRTGGSRHTGLAALPYRNIQEHKEKPVVYFYNPNLTWMIWDDSLELMQYDEIYFASLADVSTVEDDIQSGRRIRCLYMFPEWSRLRRRCRPLQMEWAVM